MSSSIIHKTRWAGLLVGLFLLLNSAARAEDTDIFLANPGATTVPPNVLIILDNTANWAGTLEGSGAGSVKKFDAEVAALKTVLASLDPDTINLGLMLLTKDGSEEGAYPRYAVRRMTSSNITNLTALISSLDVNADKTAGTAPYGVAMFEAFKYFGGGGTTSNTIPSPLGTKFYGPQPYMGLRDPKYDSGAFFTNAGTKYYDPIITDPCQKNFIIIISNGSPPTSSDAYANTLLGNINGNTTSINLPSSRSTANYGDEFARYFTSNDVSYLNEEQHITTYTLAVYKEPATGQDPDNILLMQSIAEQGDGYYFPATSASAVIDALKTIFDQVMAINSVFASVTLPVSVNVRGTNLNQVYLGVFRPDELNLPLWNGNLKQYQLAFNSSLNTIYLADKNGIPAQNATTGFINEFATSEWSHSSTFWSFDPSGTPASASDAPDGSIVEKGGVAQQLRDDYAASQSSRKVYTCTSSCLASTSKPSLSSFNFNTTTIDPSTATNQTLFGAADTAELTNIINWCRGEDNAGDENGDGLSTDIRASVHGDVLHSRPAVVNYNRDGTDNDVIIYYGDNAGLVHAVKGGKAADGGTELWSFIPQEFWGDLKRFRDNNVSGSISRRPYFMDGSISVYEKDVNGDGKLRYTDGDIVYLYLTARRGGRLIYAFDVSNPSDPKFMWHKDNTDPGYSELGYTWSRATITSIHAVSYPVIIMGAGYDPNVEDQDPIPSGVYPTMGRGVMIINALNGDLLWQANPSPSGASYNVPVTRLRYSIPSDVIALDRNSDGKTDRVYVGDTGGQVWRLDIHDSNPNNWTINHLASLGYNATGSLNHRRKFLYPPDVIYAHDGQNYDTLLIGSGDREHPFNGQGSTYYPLAYAVENHFYMLKDYSTGLSYSGSTIHLSDLYNATNNDIQEGSTAQKASAASALAAAKGAYIVLEQGEKTVGSAVTLNEVVYFNTNQPAIGLTCGGSLGTARQYRMSYDDFSSKTDFNSDGTIDKDDRYEEHPGGGFLPSPVPIVVEIGGEIHEVVCSGVSCGKIEGVNLNSRIRTFYYEDID